MKDALLDPRGCLTELGLQAVAAAPLGQGPEALVTHVARCGRCQERLLSGGRVSPLPRRRRVAPGLGRTLALAGIVLLLALVALVVGSRLLAPR